jgi:hypothetical protein
METTDNCEHKTKKGIRCKSNKARNSSFCYKHRDSSYWKTTLIKDDGKVIIQYKDEHEKLHNNSEPAYIEHDKNKTIYKWYFHGKCVVNDGKPHTVEEITDHTIGKFVIPLQRTKFYDTKDCINNPMEKDFEIERFNSDRVLHSPDFSIPSHEIVYSKSTTKIWHQDGQKQSNDALKPCLISSSWGMKNNSLQIIMEMYEFSSYPKMVIRYDYLQQSIDYRWSDGNTSLHRCDDKPSSISIKNHDSKHEYIEVYYKNGKTHRVCGPAIIHRHTNTENWMFFAKPVDKFVTPQIKSLLLTYNPNSKFLCTFCFRLVSDCTLPLECGHWIHCLCYNNKKLKECPECKLQISILHQSFLRMFCPWFVENTEQL